jgi:ribonucleotide reductase alpha subunit
MSLQQILASINTKNNIKNFFFTCPTHTVVDGKPNFGFVVLVVKDQKVGAWKDGYATEDAAIKASLKALYTIETEEFIKRAGLNDVCAEALLAVTEGSNDSDQRRILFSYLLGATHDFSFSDKAADYIYSRYYEGDEDATFDGTAHERAEMFRLTGVGA